MKKSVAPATKKAAKPSKAAKPVKATKKAVKPSKAAKAAKPEPKAKGKAAAKKPEPIPAPVPQRDTKKGQALQMLEEGTTIKALMERFGWLPHTTRGFLSVLRLSHPLNIELKDGVRVYSLK